MASGRTHRFVTALVTPLPVLLVRELSGSAVLALAAGVGCLTGLWLTPDLDQQSHAPFFWQGYARLFKHRGISHWPVVGTITRVVYLGWPCYILWGILEVSLFLSGLVFPAWSVPLETGWLGISWFCGLCVSDIAHWLFDQSWKGKKCR